MLFSSIPFLFWFLPIVLLLYTAAPHRLKNIVLLLSSLFFYGWGEPRYVLWMLLAIVMAYLSGVLIEGFKSFPGLARLILVLSVLFDLLMLGYFKYADFFISNLNAVTGLSVPLLKLSLPILDLAAYVSLFPQLIAGPIVRYSDVEKQLKKRSHTIEKAAEGMGRFITGLGKKILIANLLGELCSSFRGLEDRSLLFFWLYAFSYSLHVYYDFSGYSDMAIGLGKIFGFDFLENFNYPFISKSITEFWRRWHISLSSWFRDYVYIPLGGSRVSAPRHLFNIFAVWMLTGFWHGAAWNFVVWGLYFALLLMIEKLWLLKYLKRNRILSHIYVILAAVLSFVIFDAANMAQACSVLRAMFGGGGYPLISTEAVYYLRSYFVVLAAAVAGATPLPKTMWNRISQDPVGGKLMIFAGPLALSALLVICTAFLVDGSFNPFLYFRF